MNFFLKLCLLFMLCFQMAWADVPKKIKNAVTLDEATKQVLKTSEKDSKILSAKTESLKHQKLHIIKLLRADGLIQLIKIDVETGKKIDKKRPLKD